MSKRSPNWTREELILAFNLYIKIPYGTITGSNLQDDRAFEEGFIAINANYQILIASELKKKKDKPFYNDFFGKYDGQSLHLPDRFLPNEQFIKEHLENRFRG